MSSQQQPSSKRPWRMLLPLLLVIVLAAAWSAGWVWAAGMAEERIDAMLAREAARGRTLVCASKTISGFPFRIAFDCAAPELVIDRGQAQARFTASHLTALVQVYKPNHVIADLQGPLAVDGDGASANIAWSSAQASAILAPGEIEQADIAIKDAALTLNGADLAGAARFEAHTRKATNTTTRDFDFSVLGEGVSVNDQRLPAQFASVERAEVSGTLRAVPEGANENVRESLKLWQQERGLLEIARLWIDLGDGAVLASGTLKLEDSGRPSGALKAAVANPPALVGTSAAGPLQLVMAGLQFLGRKVDVEGRQAVEIDIAVNDGMVRLGPATLGPLPPLY